MNPREKSARPPTKYKNRILAALPKVPAVILCVDDQGVALNLRRQVLRKAGYSVLTATTAQQALDILRTNQVDLVLTDHLLPTISGTTLAAKMKSIKPEVKIAILSGVADVPEDMQFADMFITKLMPIDELLRTIERLVRKGVNARSA
jgi:DNA-binding NtrC family response regulator